MIYVIGGQGGSGYSVFLSSVPSAANAGVEISATNGSQFQGIAFNGGGSIVNSETNSVAYSSYASKGVLTLVWNGSNLQFYINGWPCAAQSMSSFTPGTLPLQIGQRGNTGLYSVNGTWSNVSVYNDALTQAQIQAGVAALNL